MDEKIIKVRCINTGELLVDGTIIQEASSFLKVGEIYEVSEYTDKQYRLLNKGKLVPYKVRFEVVENINTITTSYEG